MTTLQQTPVSETISEPQERTPQNPELALNGGPKAVTANAKDRWKAVRVRDVIPIAKYMRWGFTTFGGRRGPGHDLEEQFAASCQCKFGLVMNSGTATLHSALFAVGVGPGDEVIMPSYTWHATASAALCCGAKPVFCDIDPQTLTACPDDIERRITEQTKAIMVVHVWGNPAKMDRICDIAKKHNLPVVEDCSHAHGASYQGTPVGAWGEIGCFSFQGAKAVSAGEGGIAVCNKEKYQDRMIALGHPLRKTTTIETNGINIGPKYRPHLFGVLLAIENFKRLDRLNQLRQRNWDLLCRGLEGVNGITPVGSFPDAKRGGFLEYKLILDPVQLDAGRESLLSALKAEGVPCSRDRYGRLHEIDMFRNGGSITIDTLNDSDTSSPAYLPNTDELADRVVTLPAFVDVSESFVTQCAEAIRKVCAAFVSSRN